MQKIQLSWVSPKVWATLGWDHETRILGPAGFDLVGVINVARQVRTSPPTGTEDIWWSFLVDFFHPDNRVYIKRHPWPNIAAFRELGRVRRIVSQPRDIWTCPELGISNHREWIISAMTSEVCQPYHDFCGVYCTPSIQGGSLNTKIKQSVFLDFFYWEGTSDISRISDAIMSSGNQLSPTVGIFSAIFTSLITTLPFTAGDAIHCIASRGIICLGTTCALGSRNTTDGDVVAASGAHLQMESGRAIP